MAGFYVPLVRHPSPWMTPHVEFTTTMTFENLIMGLNDQFTLYDSVNSGAFEVLGDLSLLTTTADSDIVSAVNELDSDLWGAGGGSIAALDWEETSIVSALNTLGTIVKIEDSSREDHVLRDSSFDIIIGQPGDSDVEFNLVSEGDLYFEAGKNITANVGDKIILQHNGVDQIIYDMSDSNSNSISSQGDLNLFSTGDIGLYSTNNLYIGGDDSNPSISIDLGTSAGDVTTITSHYDTVQVIEGTLEHKVDGNKVTWKDNNDDVRATLNYINPTETTFIVQSEGTFGSQDTTTLVGSSLVFKDENGNQFGALAPIAGNNLQIIIPQLMGFTGIGI